MRKRRFSKSKKAAFFTFFEGGARASAQLCRGAAFGLSLNKQELSRERESYGCE
jgi:hypothetical protein